MADYTVDEITDRAAALCNDAQKQVYTFDALLPYLNQSLQELEELFELANIPVTDTVSAVMTLVAGTTAISFTDVGGLHLPSDLIEPKLLWERQHGVDPYVPMTKLDYLPLYMSGVEIQQFVWFTWQSQEIRVLPAIQDNDIKMDYTRNLFAQITSVNDTISVLNSKSFLQYRTGALASEFIGENKSRADDLNNYASLALDRVTGIGTKGRQAIMIRHRPFRAGYKRRSYM